MKQQSIPTRTFYVDHKGLCFQEHERVRHDLMRLVELSYPKARVTGLCVMGPDDPAMLQAQHVSQADTIMMLIERERLERLGPEHTATWLMQQALTALQLPRPEPDGWWLGAPMQWVVEGYYEDARELFQIPVIRRFAEYCLLHPMIYNAFLDEHGPLACTYEPSASARLDELNGRLKLFGLVFPELWAIDRHRLGFDVGRAQERFKKYQQRVTIE